MIVDGYTTLTTPLSRDVLLAQMDECGVERAVIAPDDSELAVNNRGGNDRIIAAAMKTDDRLIPACAATPWHGERAMGILTDAAQAGARLLVFAPSVQGFMMTDPLVDPLLTCAGKLGLTVYVQTGPHAMGAPTQTVLAAQQHPTTRFILGHCGSTDHAWDMTVIASSHMRDNLWLEASLVRPWAATRLIELAGADRVIYGSGAPLTDFGFELEHFGDCVDQYNFPGFYGQNLLNAIGEMS